MAASALSLGRLALLLLGLYAAVVVLAYFYSDSVMFQPDYGSRRAPEDMRRIPLPGGGSLAALYLPNPTAKHTLWFFHGNAEDLGDLEPFLREMHRRGFAVFAVDYPGYGLSSGAPSERSVYAATDAAARYLQSELKVPLARVILYGRSLGGGAAVELATHEPVAGLVLQSAFTSSYRVMTGRRLLPFDKFENLRKLPRVTCPVLVMHGRDDEVIPFAHGEALLAAAPGRKSHLWVDGAHHNDFTEVTGERLWQALRDFSEQLP
ncbi:MAG: alpha/beta hydrolase [Opitutae bacterium]|nr:alpha/beta hydrolase [Opitutae bacterium]